MQQKMFMLNWINFKEEAASIKQSIRGKGKKHEFIFHLARFCSK